MRKFLIKYLFGRYWWKFPGQSRYIYTDRGGFWNFLGFIILGLLGFFTGIEIFYNLTIPWALQVLYFGFNLGGFGYFSKYPVKWNELDKEQKWFYGDAAMSGELTKKLEFDAQMMTEWMKINLELKAKYYPSE